MGIKWRPQVLVIGLALVAFGVFAILQDMKDVALAVAVGMIGVIYELAKKED